jgi:hypothetical protein
VVQYRTALKNGDKRFYDALVPPFDGLPFFDALAEAVKSQLDDFKEGVQDEQPRDDDVPF